MLKKMLFLIVMFVTTPVCIAVIDKPSIDSIQLLLKQGDVDTAVSTMRQLLEDEPTNYQVWFLLGVNQAEQGLYHDAIESFHHVITLQPALAEPHNNLAVIYNETGKFRAAVNELEISLTLKPNYLTAQENIGDLYVKLAANAYRKVLEKKQSAVLEQRYKRLLGVVAGVVSPEPAIQPARKQSSAADSASKLAPTNTPGAEVKLVKTEPIVAVSMPHFAHSKQEVLRALERWRMAWSNKDLTAYFSAYSEAFRPGRKYKSLAKWKDYKVWAIRKRLFIKVNIESVVMKSIAENIIKVQFLQHFNSDSFNIDNNKEMLFRKGINGWKIIYEASK